LGTIIIAAIGGTATAIAGTDEQWSMEVSLGIPRRSDNEWECSRIGTGSSASTFIPAELTLWEIRMFEVISANSIIVWFVWGFFMALGWALGTWVMTGILGYVPLSRRHRCHVMLS
jgi:hypothetical protein